MTAPAIDSLPDIEFEQISFDLIVPGRVNQMQGRRTEKRVHGTPYWRASYQAGWQYESGIGKAEAFIRRVLSRGRVFRAHDLLRPRPIEFAGTPLTWSPSIVSITDAHTVVVAGVPNLAQFREGDYVEFAMVPLVVSLHSIAADVQANGAGQVTLSIDPALDLQHFTDDAVPNFEKPSCIMQPFDWQNAKSWQSRNPSWSAQEVFFYEP